MKQIRLLNLKSEKIMGWIVGIALIVLVFFSSSIIERHLKDIKKQNNELIKLLKEKNSEKS
ncbi:hypothetical protein [Rummeliibacillus stabekisii]|uniref:Uncharacterized protein n=1 Tax=Rummeliibacillus stabekisii TaxID=241244 RepID=A0A143HDD8_9BACL|nr:hypothetical protein [Rummeliibacillus stabekisii]AMW99758.1 hypothetical protein ATY39_10090 [Rummeliibacillus stabekisii]